MEFGLCYAESQLMSAVVAVLSENLVESIKAFYKLRKAYITLNGILEAETRYNSGLTRDMGSFKKRSVESFKSSDSAMRRMPGGFGEDTPKAGSKANSLRSVKSTLTNEHGSHDEDQINGIRDDLQDLSMDSDTLPPAKSISASTGMLTLDPSSDIFADPIDVFIHSGANLCFGLLLLMISMIPPAFGRLLLIIGFRGDRGRGLQMLWQASKFHDINGAMAGLILLGYYNTVVGFADIVPDSTLDPNGEDPIEGYPKTRCENLLKSMRVRHPKSHLWLLEEARMHSTNKDLARALDVLQSNDKSPLKQVEALNMFETALDAAYMHNHGLCAESFIKCIDLNNWSHALSYYMAGASHVELYRKNKVNDPEAAKQHAEQATTYLRTAPKHAGKKKVMARQLPFDVFVMRKVNKWEARATEWDIPFIDAVGVSPAEELIFFANGYKRMNASQLEDSLSCLSWSEDPAYNPTWAKDSLDEKAILALLRATTLRNLGQWDQARKVLKEGILKHDKAKFKGGNKDDYTMPAAHYEMGVICWMQRCELLTSHPSLSHPSSPTTAATLSAGPPQGRTSPPAVVRSSMPGSSTDLTPFSKNASGTTTSSPSSPPPTPKWNAVASHQDLDLEEEKLVKECEMWVEKAAKWESYVLDTRIGLKVTTAMDTLGKWRRKREEGGGAGGARAEKSA